MHKCVKCGKLFQDNDKEILRGCTSCGGIFFVYVKGPSSETLESVKSELRKKETTLEKEIEKHIKKRKAAKMDRKEPTSGKKTVVNVGNKRYAVEEMDGVETLRVEKEGVYEINIDALMKDSPIIIREKGDVYFIHLPDAFEKLKD